MGLVKTRRLAAMHKQQRAKVGQKPPMSKLGCNLVGRRVRTNSTATSRSP